MTYDGRRLGPPSPVLTGIPNGFIHDGGRLLFAPDGNLFVSTGETGDPSLAQDRSSLGGKILRITPEGKPAPGNPVPGSPVWTMGHRNVQGLAFDGAGRLWATEFGAGHLGRAQPDRPGPQLRLAAGGGPGRRPGATATRSCSGAPTTRPPPASPTSTARCGPAPCGAGGCGRCPSTHGRTGTPRDFFVGDYGRLRTVVAAPDGNLWVTTSNRDTRGTPRPGDDRILVVAPR